MSNIKTISGKVVTYSDIPVELTADKWFEGFSKGCYVECHVDELDARDELDNWLIENYPGIENETFFIEIDY